MNQIEFEDHLLKMHKYVHDWLGQGTCDPSDVGVHSMMHSTGRSNHKHNKDGSVYIGKRRIGEDK